MEFEIPLNDSHVRKAIRSAGATLGLFVAACAWLVPVAHTPSGGFTLEGWWVGITGVVIVLLSSTWWGTWRSAGLLASLLILSMTAQLTLILPHYLMFFRLRNLEGPLDFIALAVLIIQWTVVGMLVFPYRHILIKGLFRLLPPGRALVVGLIFISCAAHVTLVYPEAFEQRWAARIYLEWLAAALCFVTMNLLLLWRIAISVPIPDLRVLHQWLARRLSLPGATHQTGIYDRIFPWWLAALVFTATGFISIEVFDATPHIPDDAAYLFQARTFALGRLSVPAPPVPEAFEFYTLPVVNGRWFGVNVPGWPVWLSFGVLAGIPWLVNPITAALSLPAAHAAVRRISDYGTAHLAAVLLATSPWFLFISGSLQPQPVTLFFAMLAFLCIVRASEPPKGWFPLLGGLAAGLVFCVRPLDGVLMGGVLGLYLIGFSGRRLSLSSLFAYGIGCLLTGSLVLLYNDYLTGDWYEFPNNIYFDREWGAGSNRLGFGPEVGRLWGVYDKIPGHGWKDVLLNMNQNLFNLNTELFGWCIGSLFPVALHLLFSRWSTTDRFFVLYTLIFVAGLSVYWYSGGSGYGARYWYLLMLPMIYFGAQGCRTAVAAFGNPDSSHATGLRIAALVVCLICSSLIVFSSWRAVAKYPNFWWQHDGYRQLRDQGVFGTNGLVLIELSRPSRYTSAFYLNDISPERKGPVFALYHRPELIPKLLAAFPDRPVFLVKEDWSPEGANLRVSQLDRKEMRVRPLITWKQE